jgi:hypothetical protein
LSEFVARAVVRKTLVQLFGSDLLGSPGHLFDRTEGARVGCSIDADEWRWHVLSVFGGPFSWR